MTEAINTQGTEFLGISVYDLMHNEENRDDYRDNTRQFGDVVEDILNDDNFEVAIKTVQTLNTTSYNQSTILRLKNINSDFSANFKDAVVNNRKPVVLARGLWSNLLTWEEFGQELASDPQNARDTWLIELTGGPTQDCDTCPNYNYNDLVDYYWPTLIAGVEHYSGQSQIDYVGHSNGCRVGLDSIKNWSLGKNNAGNYFDIDTGQYLTTDLASNSIHTFVGVGCPGSFTGNSPVISAMKNFGSTAINNLESAGNLHPNFAETLFAIALESPGGANRDGRISLNLLKHFRNLIINETDQQPGSNLNLSSVLIIYGDTPAFSGSDFVVTINDSLAILGNIISSNKSNYTTNLNHFFVADRSNVKKQIKNRING